MKAAVFVFLQAVFLILPQTAVSHALEPGYLEISMIDEQTFRVTWRKPDVKGKPMEINAILPDNCTPDRAEQVRFDGRAWAYSWIASCPGGIAGKPILIEGLELTQTDTLVRYQTETDVSGTARLTASDVSFIVPGVRDFWATASGYFTLGVDHILEGYDHLLFVFALMLLVRNSRSLLIAITSFTVAHSITLAAASLGFVYLPPPPVETVIALSIVFLAAELVRIRADQPSLTQRNPWAVAFMFGLLHGLGFAGALRDIGLPELDVPAALVSFNLGVEAGQLIFVGAVLAAWLVLGKIIPAAARALNNPDAPAFKAMGYGIGTMASFWTIERLMSF